MTELAPIADTCQPRADVLAGGLEGKHFAAQLDQVIRNPDDYASYADAESFFALTYPTEGLKELLAGTFARFTPPDYGPGPDTPANLSAPTSTPAQASPRPPAAEHAVYRYETSFGGGKTHGLIALWHLARGSRPANVGEFIDPALLPDPEKCQVAAVSGLSLDPINGLTTGAVTTHTLWGEIARQLGPEAWRRIQPSDEARTAPGKQTWLEAIGAAPTVIVIDELAYHIRQLGSSADHRVQAQGDATVASLQSLFEAATAAPAARIVVTLATGTDAYGRETDEVQQELFGAVSDRLAAETKDVMNRPKGAIGRPAEDSEIGLILRRRLFDRVDEQAATAAGRAYQELYAGLDAAGAAAGAATSDPAAYGDLVEASYPFHPALIDCLDKRLGPLPGFQRARGALKFLAEAVRRIWSDGPDRSNESDRSNGSDGPGQRPADGRAAPAARRIPIVNLGDMPLEDDQVRAQVTSEVARQEMNEPAKADFCGPASHAHQTDGANWPAERMATRACRAVFLHSIAAETVTPGASPAEVWTGVLRPGERPELADAALGKVLEDAWHLAYDGNRWRFNSAPNARKIISTELRNVLNTDVHEHLDAHIRSMFSGADWMRVIHAAAPSEVPDAASLRLVVMPYTDVRVRTATAAPPPEAVARIAETAGASETSRRFRNSVMFAVADETEIETMAEKVRRELAAIRVVGDRDRFNQFQPDVRKGLKEERDRASLDRAVAIANTFRHLYWPASDKPNRHLRHVELPVRDHGRPDQMAAVHDLMESLGKLRRSALPTDLLAERSGFARAVGDKPAGEISTKALSEALWADPGLEILANPTTLLIESIVAGVRNGAWAYHDPERGRTFTAKKPPPSPRIAPEAMLYSPDRARALGLLDPEPTVADVAAVLAASSGLIEGPALRSGIETRLGADTPPTKAKVCELVGTGSVGHDRLVAVEGRPVRGAKPLTRAQIESAVLDRLTVMTHERAVAEGVVEDGGAAAQPVVESRPRKATVGAALQSAEAQMEDMGLTGREITRIAVTAYADGSAGTRNLRDLGRCADQLPRLTARFTGKLTASFVDPNTNSVNASFDCSRNDYDGFRDELMALADKGSDLTGHLSLGLTPNQPMTFGSADWAQLDRVLRNNAPDAVFIKVELAVEEPQGGGEGGGVDASQGRED